MLGKSVHMPLSSITSFRVVHKTCGNSAFGVFVKFGGVVKLDPGGGKTPPACLGCRFALLGPGQREVEHMCYLQAFLAVKLDTYISTS